MSRKLLNNINNMYEKYTNPCVLACFTTSKELNQGYNNDLHLISSVVIVENGDLNLRKYLNSYDDSTNLGLNFLFYVFSDKNEFDKYKEFIKGFSNTLGSSVKIKNNLNGINEYIIFKKYNLQTVFINLDDLILNLNLKFYNKDSELFFDLYENENIKFNDIDYLISNSLFIFKNTL